MIVDSHCHLDYSDLYNQLDDVINRADHNNVKYLLTICTTLDSFEKIKIIIQKYDQKKLTGKFISFPLGQKFTIINDKVISTNNSIQILGTL